MQSAVRNRRFQTSNIDFLVKENCFDSFAAYPANAIQFWREFAMSKVRNVGAQAAVPPLSERNLM